LWATRARVLGYRRTLMTIGELLDATLRAVGKLDYHVDVDAGTMSVGGSALYVLSLRIPHAKAWGVAFPVDGEDALGKETTADELAAAAVEMADEHWRTAPVIGDVS